MAATGVRCTALYKVDVLGISETHIYLPASSLDNALVPFSNLIKARLQLSGYPLQLAGARMSIVGTQNVTQILDISGFTGANPVEQVRKGSNGNDATNASDQPKACLTLIAQNAAGSKKLIYLGGVPDALIGEDPAGPRIAAQNPWWIPLFADYVSALTGGKFGWIGRTIGGGQPAKVPIISIVTDANTHLNGLVVAGAPAGIVQGTTVQVRGVKRVNRAFTPITGKWVVALITTGPLTGQSTILLQSSGSLPISAYKLGTGTVQLVDYSSIAYSTITVDKQTTRKRGNRSLAGVARRSIPKYLPL